MKIHFIFFILLITVTGCLPDNYNFKENPVYILKEALDSLEKRDVQKFEKISGKEALCLYATDSGLQRIADNFSFAQDDLNLKHQLLSEKLNEPPKFVGYWSYKTDRHLFQVFDKREQEKIMDVIIDCEFGNEGERLKEVKNYKIKQCRLTKISPVKFQGLSINKKCESLKVDLGPL